MPFKNYNGEKHLKEVPADKIIIAGVPCFIFKEKQNEIDGSWIEWNISHIETGMKIAEDYCSKKEIIAIATKRLTEHPKAIQKGIDKLKKEGFKFPVNKI